ncbi:hypothetical protein ADIS_0038 [Lunatimonas lonarensis]|uniref:Uncharacterized protein n=1 Tax=Lunatimonas lonarensis TaxID=1232681 RepID=R7ZZF3_9BACT|nr:hypothetical protein ADIS_0038 [Lunatimonas lonarensis]
MAVGNVVKQKEQEKEQKGSGSVWLYILHDFHRWLSAVSFNY